MIMLVPSSSGISESLLGLWLWLVKKKKTVKDGFVLFIVLLQPWLGPAVLYILAVKEGRWYAINIHVGINSSQKGMNSMMTARSQLIYICTTHLRCVSLERHELHFAFSTLNVMKHGPSCSAHHISALPSIQCFQVCSSCSEMPLGITTVSSLLCILNPTVWEPKKRLICGIPLWLVVNSQWNSLGVPLDLLICTAQSEYQRSPFWPYLTLSCSGLCDKTESNATVIWAWLFLGGFYNEL